MNIRLLVMLCASLPLFACAQVIQITECAASGHIAWSNSFWNTTCRVDAADTLAPGPVMSWSNVVAVHASNAISQATLPAPSADRAFYRVAYASTVLSGMVAYWSLDGNANDRCSYANHGTVNGTTPTTNRLGDTNSAFFFDGSGTYVGVPDSSSLDVTNMTLAFWFRMDSADTARELVNKFGGNGNIAFGSEYLAGDGKIRFRISKDGSNGTLNDCLSTTIIAMGTWYHFAGTYDGAEMKTYISGTLENTWATSGAIYKSSEEVKIGRYGYYGGWVFHGAIDDVAIWNRALSSNEVWELYQSQYQ